jgi:SAM-dependent methyltransferase
MDVNAWDRRYREKEFVWSLEPNEFFVTVTESLSPGRALDLAAGEGRNAIWLATRGWEVTAVDWSAAAIAKGRDLAARHDVEIDWVVADLAEWVPSPGGFDLVALLYLQVPADLRRTVWLRGAAAVAPGGRLVVIGHDLTNLDGGHGGPSSPEVLYTAAEVRSVIEESLEVVRAEPVLRSVETPEGVQQAIDNLTIAVRH